MVRSSIIVAAVVVVLVGLFFLPIEVPYSATVPGKVLPAREWLLVRDQEGSVGSLLRDHLQSNVQHYTLNRFERGDVVRLTLNPELYPQVSVAVGDTIASIYSSETERQLRELTGTLATTFAALDFHASGEKEALVNEAREQVRRAQEQAQQHEKELERIRRLEAAQAVPELDLEQAESQQRVYEADIAVAEARLETMETGAKPQQVELTRTEAAALQDQITTLQERLAMFTITSPISGVVARSFGADTLLTVQDTTAYVVVMPVGWEEHRQLSPDQAIEVAVFGVDEPITGRIQQLGDAVHILQGEQVLFVTVLLEEPPRLLPGVLASCTLSFGSLSLWEYLKRSSRLTFS